MAPDGRGKILEISCAGKVFSIVMGEDIEMTANSGIKMKGEGRRVQTICLQIIAIINFLYSLFKFSLNLSPFSQVWITVSFQAALPQGRESHFYGN